MKIEILFQFRVPTNLAELAEGFSGKINLKWYINVLLLTTHQYYVYIL